MKDNQSRKFMSFQPHDNLTLHKGEQTKDISSYEQQHYISSLWYYWEPTGSCQGWLECNQWETNIRDEQQKAGLGDWQPSGAGVAWAPQNHSNHPCGYTCDHAYLHQHISFTDTLRFPQQNIPNSTDYLHCYESWQLSSGTKKVLVHTI